MEKGYLIIQASSTNMLFPIPDIKISVFSDDVREYYTNESGKTQMLEFATPNREYSKDKNYKGEVFTSLKIVADKEGYYTVNVNGVQIFSEETSILYINMIPLPENVETGEINIETKAYDL